MVLKTPLPDEVFQRFLKTKSEKDIEKKFGRKLKEISPMEVVGNVIHKSPALLFRSFVRKKQSSKKSSKKEYYSFRSLQKEKFYEFTKDISTNDWQSKETEVFLFKKIQNLNCSKCNGSGMEKKCKTCNGSRGITCEACKSDKDLQCKECKGSGEISFNLEVIKVPESKKEKIETRISCPECHGSKMTLCKVCAGSKKQICKTCQGTGGVSCTECVGTGIVYKLQYSPVPFADSSDVHVFLNSAIEKELTKAKLLKGKELHDLLEKANVEAIKISNLKNLDQKYLEAELGFWDKEASSQIKECKKMFEKLEKSGVEDPKLPIEIYPLQKIDIETYKGKKFSVCSIGSQNGFIVFDINF
jgi:hypothetical protein